jgi:hypothetical protein
MLSDQFQILRDGRAGPADSLQGPCADHEHATTLPDGALHKFRTARTKRKVGLIEDGIDLVVSQSLGKKGEKKRRKFRLTLKAFGASIIVTRFTSRLGEVYH